jgi:hypothetical protein
MSLRLMGARVARSVRQFSSRGALAADAVGEALERALDQAAARAAAEYQRE